MEKPNGQILIGLTGGIASGKSTVCIILRELGAYIIDADEISRRLTSIGGAATAKILSAFDVGDGNGGIDRARARKIVFNDEKAREKLNSILHPMIYEETKREVRNNAGRDFIVIAAPLLFETRFFDLPYDEIWTVACPEQTRIKRLSERDNIGMGLIAGILNSQLKEDYRNTLADAVIDNSGSLKALKKAVKKEVGRLKELQKKRFL